MLHIGIAQPGEAEALARISQRAFDQDVRYGAAAPGGPPGYDSAAWQARWIRTPGVLYFKILSDAVMVGGMIVRAEPGGACELSRIFLSPEAQNHGLGAEAIQFLFGALPDTTVWRLDTPGWNRRTQHFYEKLGFVRVREERGSVHYERRMPPKEEKA